MPGPGGIVWTYDTLSPKLKIAAATFQERLGIFLEYQSENVQDYMRTNAKWTDRTGNARQGLFAKRVSDSGKHSIVCYHTMPYGIWLEVRHGGRLAIIDPTIQYEGARIMSALSTFLGKLVA